jgi:O-antigen/teichoic acid export membrane protein
MARAYLSAIGVVLLLVLPAGFGISLLADPLVKLALGWNWRDAVPVVQIIAISGLFHVIIQTGGNIFGVRGETRMLFQMSLLSAVLRVPLLVFLISRHELVGAALAVVAILGAEAALYITVTARKLAIRPRDFVGAVWRPAVATAGMCLALVHAGLGWTAARGDVVDMVLHAGAGVVLGALVYGAILAAAWLATGRPPGAEQILLRFATGFIPARGRSGLNR